MTPEYNLAPIKIGDTYVVKFAFYSDECEEVPIDVSGYEFGLQARNTSGSTILNWGDATFVQTETWERTVTLTNVYTELLTAGEFRYELQATTPEGVFTYMQGFIKIVDQITSL